MVLLILTSVAAMAVACGDDDTDPGDLTITVVAEPLETDAPVTVEATGIDATGRDTFAHQVRVSWDGDGEALLEDARFTHHVEGNGNAHLIIAGRGCGTALFNGDTVGFHCTDDLQVIRLKPGETHHYPVTVFPEVETLRLRPGVFVADERIRWLLSDDPNRVMPDPPDGEFTIRLTYTVE
jgi:hypothetical protein